ncbi:hypothetical protein IscW_ISCW000641 [Ixodes scapularis]|uniref:Uncharacterized protein n=1 Tax=Ixodes scapularis TaxID=6945 RepID=B7P1N8_IXOSC|nr:hypothetical protein IscW_ISCW000641 [Ixodes scapularis]|eukprot:XP_002433446.1 hypothetical protein IscW_ISCW000641 [Ixodes scapularis]
MRVPVLYPPRRPHPCPSRDRLATARRPSGSLDGRFPLFPALSCFVSKCANKPRSGSDTLRVSGTSARLSAFLSHRARRFI